jgi:hypothetical protein
MELLDGETLRDRTHSSALRKERVASDSTVDPNGS